MVVLHVVVLMLAYNSYMFGTQVINYTVRWSVAYHSRLTTERTLYANALDECRNAARNRHLHARSQYNGGPPKEGIPFQSSLLEPNVCWLNDYVS